MKGLGILAQVCVGFEGGFGPKGLGSSAQALAWVGVTIKATSPEGAEEIVI